MDQKGAWRQRIIEAVVDRKFDDETLVTMILAGFDQAHEEGLPEAADVCRGVADGAPAA